MNRLPPVHEADARLSPLTASYFHGSTPIPSACNGSQTSTSSAATITRVPCLLGVDEAGRGPVLGPMVYACTYVPCTHADQLNALGFQDSKVLSEADRDGLLERLLEESEWIGWGIYVHSPQDISGMMLRRQKYNLNEMAHASTIELIRNVLKSGVHVTQIYIDTVGPPESYQAKLQALFPSIDITVAKKADSLYPIVSAASIVAKTSRDYILHHWNPVEKGAIGPSTFGSGYPADPNTTAWMRAAMDGVFGFPRLMRFSWSTCDKFLEGHGAASVTWESDVLRDQALKEAEGPSVKNYFSSSSSVKRSAPDEGDKPPRSARHVPGPMLTRLGVCSPALEVL